MTKGGGWEWKTARALSVWLTGGEDQHLIRAHSSGGWATSRARRDQAVGTSHTGDVAPVGPEAHENVRVFCERFYVECKAYKNEPNWWRLFRNDDAPVWKWWKEALRQSAEYEDRRPILILKRNNRPPVFGHSLPQDFFPGPSVRWTTPVPEGSPIISPPGCHPSELCVTFHVLSNVLASDPERILRAD